MNPILRGPTALLLTAAFSFTSLTTGCKSSQNTSQSPSQSAPQNEQSQPQAASLSLDDLVAPIALYPDQLLAQVLTASMNPQEVLDGGNWIIQNQNLKGDKLVNAAKTAGFSPSMQYLMNFPQVVDNMCQEMDWTTQLGQAFQSDQKGVMDAVQRKRGQAVQAGNLASSPQMTVATKTDNGQKYVEIAPADPKVVYVPQYNPVTIYNTQSVPATPAPAQTTTVVTQSSGVSTGTAVGIGLLSFGVGMAIGAAISSNNNYYPYPAWGYGGIYYGGRPYYPPPYHPVYPGYRPAYGYHPPPNYHWTQVNNNININVNNNYYNKFNNQNRATTLPANNRPGQGGNNYQGARPGNPTTLPANNRPGQGNNTYQGARPTGNQKPGSSMANAIPSNQQVGNRGGQGNQRPGGSMANAMPGNQQAGAPGSNMNRPNSAAPANRPGNAGAGSSGNTRPNPGNAGSINRGGASPTTQPTNRGGDRGYASSSRPSTTPGNAPAARPSPSPQMQNRGGGGAFSGGSAKTERIDSSRGRASMGAPSNSAPRGNGRRN
jgi:Protein of unknown function (DUF3300)